jgi:hypothetical protein
MVGMLSPSCITASRAHLDLRDDAVVGVEIEHLLRLGELTDHRAPQLTR